MRVCEQEQVVAVGSDEGVVLLDDEPRVAAESGDVLDEDAQACGAGSQVGPVAAGGVVDGGLDLVAARAETMIRLRRACSCFMWIRRWPGRTRARTTRRMASVSGTVTAAMT